MKRYSKLCAMALSGALLFGCSNSVDGDIEGAKDNLQSFTASSDSTADEIAFYSVLNDLQTMGLGGTARLVGFDYDKKVIVMEEAVGAMLEYDADEAYEFYTKVEYDRVLRREGARWEYYENILNIQMIDSLKDVTVYIDLLGKDGKTIGRVTYLNGHSSVERVR